jgi:Cu(I)/Ag(I) efflux system membrane fusion protein
MHPQIKLTKPGKCPICNMDLIPIENEPQGSSDDTSDKTELTLSATAEKLAQIETTPVQRKAVTKEIRLVGKADYDETRLTHITAWVPGRIERMFVDYKGITVNEGDHMLELYSPELLSAQEELIQAAKSLSRLKSGSALVRKSTEQALIAAREKLKLLGLTEAQVKDIERSGKTRDKVTIYAPSGGIVVERNATEGMYVQTGTRIYSIADLSKLWIHLDAYESDLPWIRYGQNVEFSTKAIPGRTFSGKVSFISPIVDEDTRTTKVRVNVDNTKGILKPGLFVDGVVRASIYGPGKVMDASLKGKYIGPMHPEIVRDAPGECPICGMALVPAEDLGYLTHPEDVEEPLVIPDTAPLLTGTRAVVYVKDPEKSRYELREVTLGPRAGKFYIVESGLKEQELVVTKGAFKIDADLQIRGKQSMMNPKGGTEMKGHPGHNM